VAPRAHPDDGLLDTFDARVPAGQRLAVRRRLPLGAHLPHPAIAERRARAVQTRLDRPLPVWLDGTPVGEARDLSVRVEPDALTIVV
jgi:diacylglycerol kinase family enzyme